MGSKQNPRKIIHMWAEKELHNLVKMAKGGLRVPDPVVLEGTGKPIPGHPRPCLMRTSESSRLACFHLPLRRRLALYTQERPRSSFLMRTLLQSTLMMIRQEGITLEIHICWI